MSLFVACLPFCEKPRTRKRRQRVGEHRADAPQHLPIRPQISSPIIASVKSDEQLMAEYARGDRAAFDELFQRHAPVVLRVLRRQLRRPEEAQDLLQQTFLQLHRNRADYDPERALRPWLFTIALNLKREYFRRVARRPESALDLATSEMRSAGPREQEQMEAAQAVTFALNALSEDQREVISLHWLGGIPLPEIAEIVGASVSAVKVRAHRGYKAMRAALESDAGVTQLDPPP